MKSQDQVMADGEIPAQRLPQCLELVGAEANLQAYLRNNRDHLAGVRTIFLRGQDAAIEAAVEKGGLGQVLAIEHTEVSEHAESSEPGGDQESMRDPNGL